MDYKSIIESRYDRQNWQGLLYDIFRQKVQFWQQPQQVPVDKEMAKQALYTGKITLPDGHIIAIYEVELSDTVIIERNRAGIRNLLCTNWRGMGCAGAFMFCYRQNEAVLRFSYVSESFAFAEDGTLTKESTDTKRFTYLLGEGHRSRTAIQQFEELKASKQDLKAITKAFSVEALSDMFFKEYKKNYEDIIEFITGKRMVKVANKWEERVTGNPCKEIMAEFDVFPDAEKAVRDYVKKLMGRLVFIQFLQKKGWMGCSAGTEWNDGDKEFVQTLFAKSQYKNTFVDDVLEPLFDDINTKRDGDLVSDSRVGTGIKVPYLNGGLFEHDDYDKTKFPLPAKYMKQMLDFFASYNFTIDENDPDDAEIGVDPEMLGRIFENLLEDNKDKGAFYTPKEIVQYMCRESLIAYLQTDIEEEATKDIIRQFVTTYNADLLSSELAASVDQKLKDVKICDPAIGSGAFPMGLLRELYACRRAIEGLSDEKAVEIKTHIIQQNIYGVDIEKGAVDIARLRFWLALIVDEKTPHALPNMDFKIMQGNSLLEQYKGFDLSKIMSSKKKIEGPVQMTFFEDDVDDLRRRIIELRRSYYTETDKEKKKSIRKSMRDIVQQQIKTLSYNIDLSGIDIAETSEFFLWHTWFADVFENGGFDIVVGNPPYIQLQADNGLLGRLYQDSKFETFDTTGDIYCLFYEHGIKLLKEKGLLCYITSSQWIKAGYGKNTRNFLANNSDPLLLIDFTGIKIFKEATVDTNILLTRKSDNNKQTISVKGRGESVAILGDLSRFVTDNYSICEFSTSDSWLIFGKEEGNLRSKIKAAGKKLKNWNIVFNRGILTGFNDAYIIEKSVRDKILSKCNSIEERKRTEDLIQPVLRGRDVRKYGCKYANLYLINVHNGVKNVKPRIVINDYPAVKEWLDGFYEKISSRSDKGDTPYNLRNCAYIDSLKQSKIVYPETTVRRSEFFYDETGFALDKTTFFIVGEDLLHIQGVLASKLMEWYLEKELRSLGKRTIQYSKQWMENVPISVNKDTRLVELVKKRNKLGYDSNSDTITLETQIDRLVYKLYDLTPEEIAIVENSTK